MEVELLAALKKLGIRESCDLMRWVHIHENVSKMTYLFQVCDYSKEEILNTNGYRLYGVAFLKALQKHIGLRLITLDDYAMYEIKTQCELELFEQFF